jgi:hypothetical protein
MKNKSKAYYYYYSAIDPAPSGTLSFKAVVMVTFVLVVG